MKNIVSNIKYLLLHLKTITTSGYLLTKVIKRSETLTIQSYCLISILSSKSVSVQGISFINMGVICLLNSADMFFEANL